MSNPTPPAQPQRPSWFQRNKLWFLPTIIIAPLALFALFIYLTFSLVMGVMRNSDAYQTSFEACTANATVQTLLGTPMEQTGMVTGNVSTTNGSGNAQLQYTVTGPKASGLVFVEGTSTLGNWRYSKLQIAIGDTLIDLNE